MSNGFNEKYGPWALVTGATSGIGREIARILARRGLNVVIVARREELLKTIAASFQDHFRVEVRPVVADFSKPGAAKALADAVKDLDIGLVVPNAGVEVAGEFIAADIEHHTRLNQINVIAPTELAHVFGRQLADRGRGGILLTSSLVAYQGTPMLASYAAGKAYILSLGEALNAELGRHGIDVTVLSPGVTRTTMIDNIPIDFQKMPLLAQSPERVARIGLNALGRKASVVSGLINKIYAFENRFLPRMLPVKLFGFLMRRALKSDAPVWTKRISESASLRDDVTLARTAKSLA